MASTPSPATAVPLRPELFEFIGVQGLGRFACCSAALREELRDAKAWQQLANTRMPRSKREAELAAERDAARRVRAYDRRRQLADILSGKDVPLSKMCFYPNKFADFTFFVRFEEDGEVIWESDLKPSLRGDGDVSLSLSEAWTAMKDSLAGMVEFLEAPSPSTDLILDGEQIYLHRLGITVVAIRDEDQAMVSFGHFVLDCNMGLPLSVGSGDGGEMYVFRLRDPHGTILLLRDFSLKPVVELYVTHDKNGGTLNSLQLGLFQNPRPPRRRPAPPTYVHQTYRNYPCEPDQLELLLTFLAGVHRNAHLTALDIMERWHDIAVNKWEALRRETMAAMTVGDDGVIVIQT